MLIRARPPKEMVRRGEVARLRCEAEGDEPIKITWNVKGISINDTNDQRYGLKRFSVDSNPGSGPGSPAISELIIQQVSLTDRGDVECVAVNSFGHDSLRVSLLVQERPQPPKEFRVMEHTSRSVVLSWALPTSEDDAHVLDYVLSYKEESGT
ncbi:Down syndrome cell adhesion molecule-like protein Dscam2 [Orchesella cincta]|uniref:Down syndrome cell adhesion molecule-like protein Dscam2 n=1 Tax=Orchesella cincta TaxID=48709 RepID=A0A1D2N9X7_ORCCI|nr:Down syndrome cell adhesion molecule-like protein Dscam2 [Orchesella cincta]